MFKWLQRGKETGSRPTPISHPKHYKSTAQVAPGGPDELTLTETVGAGAFLTVVYTWTGDLSPAAADRLDSRLRAFVACAIHDAAGAAGISSTSGPPHGRRPSWLLGQNVTPVSVVDAGFDPDEKMCFVQVGPVLTPRSPANAPNDQTERLLSGFKLRFSRIRV